MRAINHAWRLIGTALGFFFFGLGSLVLRVLVFPVVKLITPATNLERRSRLMVHYSLRAHVWLLRSLGVLKLNIYGAEKLNRPGQLVLANHPCLLDVVFLMSLIRNCNCIVKHSLWVNPFTRGPVVNAGYVSNYDSLTMVEQCADSLRGGDTLLIFPEGTRSTPGKALAFQRGAAQIALRSETPVTPVVIYGELPAMTKAMKWYQIPKRKMSFSIYVGDDLDICADSTDKNRDKNRNENISVAVRRATDQLHHYFTRELEKHDAIGKRNQTDDYRYAQP